MAAMFEFVVPVRLKAYALLASSDPSGRKYWVPRIGSDTLRSNSCRS